MPSPESSRRNLEHARELGRVKFWRTRGESQRIKAEILWIHHSNPGLPQRAIALMLHCRQPYVTKILRRVRLLGIERAIGSEAYVLYRERRDAERREHFQAVGGLQSFAPSPESDRALIGPQSSSLPSWATPKTAKSKETSSQVEYVELRESTDGGVIEIHGSRPATALSENQLQQLRNPGPALVPAPYSWVKQFSAKEISQLFVADQCPSFGRR